MKPLRPHLLALAVVCGLSFAGIASTQSKDPTPEQQKQIDAARADLDRAAQRLAELTRSYGGHGLGFDRAAPRPVVGVLLAPDAGGGVRIAGVTPDGAAGAAGIKSGDRLLRIGGKTIEGATPESRVENARKLLQALDDKTPVALRYARGDAETDVKVTPKLDTRIMIFGGDGRMMRPDGNVIVHRLEGGAIDIDAGRLDIETLQREHPMAEGGTSQVFVFPGDGRDGDGPAPHAEHRVIRIECKGDNEECRRKQAEAQPPRFPGAEGIRDVRVFRFDCKPGERCEGQQKLSEAFRWNGLNLASVDAQLGRYFGTDKGVLVLSTGPSLGQLQAGDVIQRVDGKAVATPRAVMDALRDKPADSSVAVDYLRDRTSGATRIKVPKAMAFPALPSMPPMAPMPPMSPMAPMPPHPPKAGGGQQATGGAATVTQRRIVIVDKDGRTQTWEDDGSGPMPALPAPPVPPAHVD